jgi:hypothetical protein
MLRLGKALRLQQPSKFGLIHPPRTRTEKIKHAAILGTVPLEIAPALEERKMFHLPRSKLDMDPITAIMLRYETSPETELIEAMCKAVACGVFEESVWDVFHSRIREHQTNLNAVDSALILKCIMLHVGDLKESWVSLQLDLLDRVCSIDKDGKPRLGKHTVLYGLQGLNRLSSVIDKKQNLRYFNFLIRNIHPSSAGISGLIGIVQAISLRFPVPSAAIIAPVLAEVAYRLSQESVEIDADALFGLLSAVGRLNICENADCILSESKRLLIDPAGPEHILALSTEQLAGLAHVYSRQGPAVTADNIDIFAHIGNELTRCEEWTPRVFSVTVNAFGTASVSHTDLLLKLKSLRKTSERLDSMQLAMVVFGLSRMGALGEFAQIVDCVGYHLPEFNLHSTSKIIAAVSGTEFDLTNLVDRMIALTTDALSAEDLDSVLLVLHSLKPRIGEFRTQTEQLVALVSEQIDSVAIEKVATLCYAFSSVDSPAVKVLVDSAIRKLPITEENADLQTIVKILHAASLRTKLDSHSRAEMHACVRGRAMEIRNLSYRPLTRLAAAMVRCGIFDDDIVALIDERIAETTRKVSLKKK